MIELLLNITASIRLLSIAFILSFYSSAAICQEKISGTVRSQDNSPVSGATISNKGTKNAVLSATDGSYSISAKTGDVLLVSSVGMVNKTVPVRNSTTINITLSFSIHMLDDVVVIGYGTAKKKDLTGAVASVSEKNFNKGIFTSPDQLIQGKISGVQITSNDGSPGGAITVKIRGNSALTGTGQPLYVVDGVPLDGRSLQADNNPLNFLNPIDIASIDVLKDASATAIYGSRAAYGVVMINTKKGEAGAAKLDVTVASGVSSVLKKIRVLNAPEYRDAIKYYGVDTSFDKGENTDGQDAILQHGSIQEYSIAGSGGNDHGKYRFSAGFLNQDGIVTNTGFKKYSADISANLKLLDSKKLGFDFHVNTSQYLQSGSTLSFGNGGTIFFGLGWNPTAALKNADGSIKIFPGDGVNPIAFSQYAQDNLKVTTILGNISPYYKFTDWLEYKLLVSLNYSSGISRSSTNQALAVYNFFPAEGNASIKNNELTTQQITQTLNLNKEIVHNLNLNAVGGYEYMQFITRGFSLSANGPHGTGFGNYGLDYTDYIQFSDPASRTISSYLDPNYELQSIFGRALFNYKDKYLLTATLRADGSTKFGANNKYGYFPSFAIAWNIRKEQFFKADFVNSLKIRGGWGKTGNQEFPPGSSQALYAFQTGGSIIQVNSPNPDLKWQSDRQYNIGVDFTIFNNRFSGTLDYFNKNTTNLLFPSPPSQPAPPGSRIKWTNLDGQIVNEGLEISIDGAIIKSKDFSWDLVANATFLKNNVSGLSVPVFTGDVSGPVEIIQNGHPMSAFYTRKFLGLDKSTGLSIYQDDGATFYYVGDPNPNTLVGFSSTFRYKKISMIANLYGSFGQQIFNATLFSHLNVSGIMGGNLALSVFKNPVKESLANPSQSPSSRYIQNGDYLKMSNLTIIYKLGEVVKTFKEANIYITAQNLFVLTNYPGFDPEVNVDRNINGVPSLSIDNVRYPSSRAIIFGINFSL